MRSAGRRYHARRAFWSAVIVERAIARVFIPNRMRRRVLWLRKRRSLTLMRVSRSTMLLTQRGARAHSRRGLAFI
jgi:hypothetical protein